MESFSQAHRNLQMFCADFWEKSAECVVILDAIGISPSAVDMTPPAIMRWYSIIRHLMRLDDGSMGRLVVALMDQYPQNDALRAVCAPWIPALPAQLTAVPKSQKLLPVVVPVDFADEADAVVPKIDTLWITMVETNVRLTRLEATVLSMQRADAAVTDEASSSKPSNKGKA